MDDIIQEATEAYEQGRDAGYAVGDLLQIIKNQKVEIDILIRKKKTLRDEIAEKDAHIAGLQKVNAEMFDTIGEKYAEIERLKTMHSEMCIGMRRLKSEAYTRFADKAKDATFHYYDSEIDEIAKELTKEE